MTKNMLEILKSINNTHGQIINNLIKSNILTVKDIVSAAIESKDPRVILSVAIYTNDLSSEDIEKLTDAIISIGKSHYIYCFARNIKEVPLEKLADAITATEDAKYISSFVQDALGIPEEYKNKMHAALERNKKRR